MDTNRLKGMAATAIVLFGGFEIPSVYAQATQFKTDFEGGGGIPACTNEEVVFSGTIHFVIQDVNGHQTFKINYINMKAEGVETGTKYTVHESDHFTTVSKENGDTKLSTIMHDSFVSSGSGDNTKVTIKLVTVIHANGDVDTIVDDIDVKCPG